MKQVTGLTEAIDEGEVDLGCRDAIEQTGSVRARHGLVEQWSGFLDALRERSGADEMMRFAGMGVERGVVGDGGLVQDEIFGETRIGNGCIGGVT